MGRLKDKLRESQRRDYQEEPEYEQEYEPTEEELAEYYQQQQMMQQEQQRLEQLQKRQKQQQIQVPKAKAPLAILEEIKQNPSPKGTLPVLIGGRPIDLHILEDYIIKISPHALKTILRYHNARTIEEIKNYSRGPQLKVKSGFWILIIALIGILILGLFVLMFAPQLTQGMKNFIPT